MPGSQSPRQPEEPKSYEPGLVEGIIGFVFNLVFWVIFFLLLGKVGCGPCNERPSYRNPTPSRSVPEEPLYPERPPYWE